MNMMNVMDQIYKAKSEGYSIKLIKGGLCLKRRKRISPKNRANPLDEVKEPKRQEILNDPHVLVAQALIKATNGLKKPAISEPTPNFFWWIEATQKNSWKRMITMEREINKLASRNDKKALLEALGKYKAFLQTMIKPYRESAPDFFQWIEAQKDSRKKMITMDREINKLLSRNDKKALLDALGKYKAFLQTMMFNHLSRKGHGRTEKQKKRRLVT